MILVRDDEISYVDFTPSENDTDEIAKYKDLQNKEYAFCVKIIDDIVIKATKIYDKQMNTGKAQKLACDFARLEQALEEWNKRNN